MLEPGASNLDRSEVGSAGTSRTTRTGEVTAFLPLTKGFEFEFLYIWRFDVDTDGNMEIPVEGEVAIKDGYIVVAYDSLAKAVGRPDNRSVRKFQGHRRSQQAVHDLLKKNGVDLNDYRGITKPLHDPNHPLAANTYNTWFYRWDVEDDGSVDLFEWGELDRSKEGKPYYIHPLELVSPVFLADSDAAANEVSRVLRIIKSNLIYLTPRTAGLHVHLGQGPTPFPLDHLKKIAIILYSIDI